MLATVPLLVYDDVADTKPPSGRDEPVEILVEEVAPRTILLEHDGSTGEAVGAWIPDVESLSTSECVADGGLDLPVLKLLHSPFTSFRVNTDSTS